MAESTCFSMSIKNLDLLECLSHFRSSIRFLTFSDNIFCYYSPNFYPLLLYKTFDNLRYSMEFNRKESTRINKCCNKEARFLITYLSGNIWTVCEKCISEQYFAQCIKSKRILN